MDSEARADYQQQQDDLHRFAEEEERRYLEAHPLADKCRNHPERDSVSPTTYAKQFCEECLVDRLHRYADYRTPRLYDDDAMSAWIFGAGDRPSSYFEKEPKK